MTTARAAETERLQIIVLAKAPVPGEVKTRLSPRYSPEDAAQLAMAALLDTLDAVCDVPGSRCSLVLQGEMSDALPRNVLVLPQRGAGLGERIDNAFADVFALTTTPTPTLLVGMDTPQITSEHLGAAGGQLAAGVDAVLGPAEDGGFWVVGLRRWMPGLFSGVRMSQADSGRQQLLRLRAAGLRVRLLPMMRDVDTPDDAKAVAEAAPSGRFARALFEVDAGVKVGSR